MFKYSLNDSKIINVSVINILSPEGPVKIQLSYKYSDPHEADKPSVFSILFELCKEDEADSDDKTFYFSLEVAGLYNVEITENASELEIDSKLMEDLFPFLRASVATVMSASGMSPFFIPVELAHDALNSKYQ